MDSRDTCNTVGSEKVAASDQRAKEFWDPYEFVDHAEACKRRSLCQNIMDDERVQLSADFHQSC